MSCIDCTDDLEHCHAVLVRHANGVLECVDDECTIAVHVHTTMVDCADLATPCRC